MQKKIISHLVSAGKHLAIKDTKKAPLTDKDCWICYRCNLAFETNSIASLHTALYGHPTTMA